MERILLFKLRVLLVLFFFAKVDVYAQSLFENALDDNESNVTYSINGFVRSSVFSDFKESKDVTAETSLKLETRKEAFGKAFVEARYKKHINNTGDQEKRYELYLREAYCDLSFNKFDLRIGQQIIVWGRADGFNPTNNITPSDMTVFSSDEDERRLENFVTRIRYNFHPLTIELNWIPVYRATKLSLKNIQFPNGIDWAKDDFPSMETNKSSYGLKIDLIKAAFDASVSFYDGFYKRPSIVSLNNTEVIRSAFQTKVIGADFSTVIGSYGLRGEFALSIPDSKKNTTHFIPYKQFEYTIGIDREWGNVSLIAQYIGKHLINYSKPSETGDDLQSRLYVLNTIFFSQTKELTHSMSLRPAANLMQETLSMEVLTLINFSTGELYFKPLLEYQVSDNIELILGAQLYYGPDDTLFGRKEKQVNAAFAEIKISF